MPIAALIALAEQYGPTLFGLAVKYGPTVVGLFKQYGPALESEIGPLIAASADAGTLAQDIAAIVGKVQALAPLLGELSSLADIAAVLGSVQPADLGNPQPGERDGPRGSKAR